MNNFESHLKHYCNLYFFIALKSDKYALISFWGKISCMTITLIGQVCDITHFQLQTREKITSKIVDYRQSFWIIEKLVKKIGLSVQVFIVIFRYCFQSTVSSCLPLLVAGL